MKSTCFRWSLLYWAAAAVVAGVGAGCGGGGGGDETPPPTLALTAANHETVSHDAAAGLMALGATTSIPLASSATVAGVRAMPAGWSGRAFAQALRPLQVQAAASADGFERPLAVIGPVTEPCMVSGATTTTIDDRDGNNQLSAGDVATVQFSNCKDSTDETLNGTTTLAVTQIGSTSMSARLTMTSFSDVTPNHSLTLDGSMLFELSSTSASVGNFKTTAVGPVRASIVTHLPFTDTVTLQDGFVIRDNVDTSVPPPPGSTGATPGRTITTVSGRVESAAAGGTFDVTTPSSAPITKYAAEDYPRSGVLTVKGKTGTLTLTSLSASSVKIDLDANDDTTPESSQTRAWDWLL